MTWELFYLVCFLIGVTLSLLSFIGGSLHLPHLHVHFHLPDGHVPSHVAVSHGASGGTDMPHINFATVTAFLAWFGAAGYLLALYSTLVVTIVLAFAIAAGMVGATIIFWFVVKFLLRHERDLNPADYDRVGVLGRIASPIAAGGTGEIIFSQAGTRHTCGARCESGEALPRGTEVVITRYEHGIAYVRRWDEMARAAETAGNQVR